MYKYQSISIAGKSIATEIRCHVQQLGRYCFSNIAHLTLSSLPLNNTWEVELFYSFSI